MTNSRYEAIEGTIIKPPLFYGERFEYWKDKLKSFYISLDPEFWDIVEDDYEAPKDVIGVKISRKKSQC